MVNLGSHIHIDVWVVSQLDLVMLAEQILGKLSVTVNTPSNPQYTYYTSFDIQICPANRQSFSNGCWI